jgi:hypothetical protein
LRYWTGLTLPLQSGRGRNSEHWEIGCSLLRLSAGITKNGVDHLGLFWVPLDEILPFPCPQAKGSKRLIPSSIKHTVGELVLREDRDRKYLWPLDQTSGCIYRDGKYGPFVREGSYLKDIPLLGILPSCLVGCTST